VPGIHVDVVGVKGMIFDLLIDGLGSGPAFLFPNEPVPAGEGRWVRAHEPRFVAPAARRHGDGEHRELRFTGVVSVSVRGGAAAQHTADANLVSRILDGAVATDDDHVVTLDAAVPNDETAPGEAPSTRVSSVAYSGTVTRTAGSSITSPA
jgi:hypothetical protein